MSRFRFPVTLFVVAYLLGAASVMAFYIYPQLKPRVSYTTKSPITAEVWSGGLVRGQIAIPEGVEVIHESFMSEGYDILRLSLNVEGSVLSDCFDERVDERSSKETPYWVRKAAN